MNIFRKKNNDELDALKQENVSLKEKLEELTQRIEELSKDNSELTEKLSDSFDNEQVLKTELNETEKVLEETKENLEEVTKEVQEVVEMIPDINETATAKAVEILSEVGHPSVEISDVQMEVSKTLVEQFMEIDNQAERQEFFRKHKNELFKFSKL
jgi:chromosome segregation ATPase